MSAPAEAAARQSVVDAARAWLGAVEGGALHREIVAAYNAIRPLPAGYVLRETDPWCAAFVSAAAAKAGLTALVFPECSCPRMAALYRAAGRWEEVDFAVPKPGDVIFYDWDGDRVPDHVGLVAAHEDDLLTVIEGNRADAVGLRRLSPDSPYILGYGQPDYYSCVSSEPSPLEGGRRPGAHTGTDEGSPSAAAPDPDWPLPTLAAGAAGEDVRAAQLLLIGRGFRCGPCGADGEFGPGTRGGVLCFQRGRGLEADGVVGAQTWRALLGLGVGA